MLGGRQVLARGAERAPPARRPRRPDLLRRRAQGLPRGDRGRLPTRLGADLVVHLIRHSLRLVPDRNRKQVARDLRPIYTAVDADAAAEALTAFEAAWGERYPMIGNSWRETWEHVVPFLAFPPDVRRSSTRPTRSRRCTARSARRSKPEDTSQQRRPPAS